MNSLLPFLQVRKEEEREKEALDAARRENATNLELDPETGRYRPRKTD